MNSIRENGMDPFGKRFDRTHNTQQIKEQYEEFTKEDLDEKDVSVTIAGRIMTKRGKGKSWFCSCARFKRPNSNICA